MGAKELYRMGVKCLSSGDTAGAIEAFEQALGEDDAFYMARLGWAQALDRGGDVDGAIQQIRHALESAPEEPLAHASLSRLYQQ